MSYQWVADVKAHDRNLRSKVLLRRENVTKHPLNSQGPGTKGKGTTTNPLSGVDPLKFRELDPLTRMAVDSDFGMDLGVGSKPLKDSFEPWNVKKSTILTKFTTQEKLSITTSVYTTSDHEVRGVSEKVLHRLEQLDLDTGSRQFFGGLTQEEYTAKISQLDQQLSQAWQADMRVNSLKIAIQCCKLLGDTSVIYFYPSKFVIITDILDKFGEMVYTRLRGKQTDLISAEVAKETCKNWFFKVGSIRELLPRICIELAILKSSSFVTPSPDYGRILSRLLSSMWGIGDPVVAIYMRCYLCRVAMDLVPNHKEIYMQCFQDLLLLHDQVLDNFRNSTDLAENKVSMEKYVTVLSPAVEWILQCLVHRGEHLHYTVQLVSTIPLFWKSVLMVSVLSSFPPSFIAEECLSILETILSLESNLGMIIKSLGMCLIVSEPQHDHIKEIWRVIWPQIRKLYSRDDYLSACQVWAEFMIKHFGVDTMNEFLEDILNHVSYRDLDHYQGKLSSIVEKLLTYSTDITALLTSDAFVKLVSMLNSEIVKSVLIGFISKHSDSQGDALVVNTLMHFSSTLHDSVDALTPVDEVKQIGSLINGFILRVDFGRDFEKQLQFYDEARGSFTNIDAVLVQLVQCVCRLGMEVRSIVDGHHTKRTKGFLSACVAYGFITTPSLENTYTQLQLYLLIGQVAYSNQCVSQGDSCLKAAISLLSESMSEIGEALQRDYISNLLSTLLAVPDHPKEPVVYLLRGLMSFGLGPPALSLKCLALLSAYAQEHYPYEFDSVDSNNALYGGDQAFIGELNTIASSALTDTLNKLKLLGDEMQLKKQSKLSLDLFMEIINWGDLSQMGNLALNLWNLFKKNCDQRVAAKTVEAIRMKSKFPTELDNLMARMTVD